MNTLPGLTSILWWMMLLSTTAIILYDIVGAIPRKMNSARTSAASGKRLGQSENDVEIIATRIRRSLQRPSSFRLLRKEIAETIISSAMAAKGLPPSRTMSHELVIKVLRDPDVAQYVEENLSEGNENQTLQRGEVFAEFERMIRVLEKAKGELT